MAGHRTRDGISLNQILRVAQKLGASLRPGSGHIYILNYPGLRPCPVATSTHARRMVAPWLAQLTGYTATEAYEAIRRG